MWLNTVDSGQQRGDRLHYIPWIVDGVLPSADIKQRFERCETRDEVDARHLLHHL